jgi:hypothetical protein
MVFLLLTSSLQRVGILTPPLTLPLAILIFLKAHFIYYLSKCLLLTYLSM